MSHDRIAVVACGVFEWNLQRLQDRHPDLDLVVRILPAQLHNNPNKLRDMLQEQVDELARDPDLRAVVVGYGLCGRGTVGLTARRVPLILPRVQDCIGAFLGSHQRHMDEFCRHPGTRYMTQGWYAATVGGRATGSHHTARNASLYGPSYEQLKEAHGADNAAFICQFRESWRRNYDRAAYVRFPGETGSLPGQSATASLADELGWQHEVLEGDESLLEAMVTGRWIDPRVLVVPPEHKVVTAPGDDVMGYTLGLDSHVERILERYAGDAAQGGAERRGLGLGVDTGGTYTDAVIYDFDAAAVVAAAKAPTTHGNLVAGIAEGLDALPRDDLERVERVGLSTTLATNAFVESKGRAVGLLLMSPYRVDTDTFPFRYVEHLQGAMNMDGEETLAVDPEQVKRCALRARELGCKAVAVSGFGSVINPAHERQVADIVLQATDLHAVCGHELTTRLNFVERATTAAMNAKLIPLIEDLLDAVRGALERYGLADIQVMVVTGDGSQLLDDVARVYPVETVLSGPAASVVGAARLLDATDAVVADMGGTTLDVARLHDGAPVLSEEGARIGSFRTSVRAMDVHTVGLGGDSEIDLSAWPRVRIGPRRVVPLCRLRDAHPAAAAGYREMLREVVSLTPNCTDLVLLAPGVDPAAHRLLPAVADGPVLLGTLARRFNRATPEQLPWRDLEGDGMLVRYGLTLTDVMHWQGTFTSFDRSLPDRLLATWSALLDVDVPVLVERILHEYRRVVCDTALSVVLPERGIWEDGEGLRHWLTAHMSDEGEGALVRACLPVPFLGVGAPADVLFPQLAPVLGTRVDVTPHAAVANAVGAVAGDVLLRETARVRVTGEGAFVCSWRGGSERSAELGRALDVCEEALCALLRSEADANRVAYREPVFTVTHQQAESRDGTLFLGIALHAELRG